MKVRILKSATAAPHYLAHSLGDIVNVSDAQGHMLIADGLAEVVKEDKAIGQSEKETAVMTPKKETAVKK